MVSDNNNELENQLKELSDEIRQMKEKLRN
jgi:hypothetical protein